MVRFFRSAPARKEDGAMRTLSWRARLALIILAVLAIATVAVTNRFLTDRFTETTRNRAELRLVLYGGNLLSELRRNAIVPQLLARDPALISALASSDYSLSTSRLISFNEEISAASLTLLDSDGRVVASTNRESLGELFRDSPVFIDALRSKDNIFNILRDDSNRFRFYYSRRVETQAGLAGVILVEVGLSRYERAWAGISDAILVTDSEGRIVLATEPRWRGLQEEEALAREPPSSAIRRALQIPQPSLPVSRHFPEKLLPSAASRNQPSPVTSFSR